MVRLFAILLLSLAFCAASEAGRRHRNHPSAIVVGTVYCDTCFQRDFSKNSHFIPGASVLVECKEGNFKKEVKTDEHGEFKVDLPFTVSKHVKRIEKCSVELIRSSEPYCAVASSATSSSLHLKSRREGIHVFSAGFFTFKPLKQPILCNQKPSDFSTNKDVAFPPPITDPPVPQLPPLPLLPPLPQLPLVPPVSDLLPTLPPLVPGAKSETLNKTGIGSSKDFALTPPIQDPPVPVPTLPPLPLIPKLPPLPQLPLLPPLPQLPNLPPLLPGAKSQTFDQKVTQPDRFPRQQVFPPFPFLPPPIPILQPPPILPPNPLLPPPSPLIPLPPNPLQPPASPLIPIPPIPGLTPPPPPPAFPIPLPPFLPFPRPSFPGIPPASTTP